MKISRPSPALVVAGIALFVSLGGTSMAAMSYADRAGSVDGKSAVYAGSSLSKAAGKLVTTQVGTLDEARRAEAAGVDFIVARGREGGGHGRDEVGTLALLQIVLDRVDLPVVAAGGIATAAGLSAVLAAGAVGAWVGTAFLCCRESAFPAVSRERLLAADDTATAYGRVFDVAQRAAWPPEYGGRALRNRFFDEWVGREDELAANPDALDEYAAGRRRRDFDVAAVYAGQGAALLRSETTAAEVVAAFFTEE